MKILVSYRGIPQSRGWATGDSVVRAFQGLGHDAHAYAKYYQKDEWIEDPRSLEEKQWDLILMMECNDTDRWYFELFDQTRFLHRRFATWYFDVVMSPGYWSSWQSIVAHRRNDEHFVGNPLALQGLLGLQHERVHYLPYAADPEIHERNRVEKTHDVTLVGSDRPERRALIEELCNTGLDAHLISNIYREEYINMLAASRLSICDVAGGGDGLLPMRVFEAPAAGSLLVTPSGQGAEEIMGGHAIYYDSPRDLQHICFRLISDDWDKIKKMTLSGQNHIFQHHTYRQRCETILETCFGEISTI